MASYSTLTDLFLDRIRTTPDRLAFRYPSGESDFLDMSWGEAGSRVRAIACGLIALGLRPEQCCAIMSGTRVEWILADLAVLCAGGATTTVYPSSAPPEAGFVLSDSGCVVAFVEDSEQLAKVRACRNDLPALAKVVLLEGDPGDDDWVVSLSVLEALGAEHDRLHPDAFDERAKGVRAASLATIIYTSGTTGQPKGVRLTHDAWVYQSEAGEAIKLFSPDDHQYLWLPLSHAFGKVLEVCAIRVGFSTTVDARIPKLMDNLAVVQPTFMGAPPRIFEKIYGKVMLSAEQTSGVKRAIFDWAISVGRAASRVQQAGKKPTGLLLLKQKLADKLVFSKIRARFGGRMRFMFSGAAPLPYELAEFFHAAGLLILEGYGLTETAAGAVLNRLDHYAFGTVGAPLPGTELRLDEDGEILLKSRGLMLGYHNRPEETLAALTPDGWLRTGDVGELDERGFLRITDRKKDLIKTSSGLYVSPQKIAGLVKAQCPYVAQVVVHGDRRSHCVALLSLDGDAIKAWAREAGLGEASLRELALKPEVRALIQPVIERVNSSLASHEVIRGFNILPEELSIENGLLTPSMKLRRKAAEQRYQSVLDSLYLNGVGPLSAFSMSVL
jgi:long-chain acyl-CoA synthetase